MAGYEHPESWTDPLTGLKYDLSHCAHFVAQFTYRADNSSEIIPIEAKVLFSDHCFTRGRPASDTGSETYCKETKKNGVIEERVFCADRWNFSKQIPEIIENLNHKACLSGHSKNIVYRQEKTRQSGEHGGWYLCISLNHSKYKDPNLELRVTSCHYRTNRPVDIRSHGAVRFFILLNNFLRGKIKHKKSPAT